MNYFNCLMNSYQISQGMDRNYQVVTLLQRQNIIKMLSFALKNSILAYHQKCLHSSLPPVALPHPQGNRKNGCESQKKNIIEILSDDQQQPIRKQLKISQNHPPVPQKLTNVPKAQELSLTSEEVAQDDDLAAARGVCKTKGIKKGKGERKDVEYHVPIPEIDEIQVCSLPSFGLKRDGICKIRYSLLRRRVFEWVSLGKKQKREVRMLDH